ncbi:MAG: IS30 family transposase [Methylophilaceae bacterium]
MKHYKQLTSELRYQIYGLKQAGLKRTEIAQKIGVNKSTITREFKRNQGQRGWRPKQAQALCEARRQACYQGRRFSDEDWAQVTPLIRQDFSPEQAAYRLKLEGRLQISHERIYQHIYADKRSGGDLHQHLRSQKPRRKRYASGQERRGVIKNRISIEERPEIVAQKTRLGDWEGDTVIDRQHKGGLVTLAERKSRYVLAGHIPSKHAEGVTTTILRLFAPHQDCCHTIYFAHPYHSWERGLNENSNGLLRQYFPKGMVLTDVTEEEVQKAVDRRNHRPRKVLSYKTPHEVFFSVEMRYTVPPLSVALQA